MLNSFSARIKSKSSSPFSDTMIFHGTFGSLSTTSSTRSTSHPTLRSPVLGQPLSGPIPTSTGGILINESDARETRLRNFIFVISLLIDDSLFRMRAGMVGCQLWTAYAPCGSQHKDAVQITLEQIDLIKRLVDLYPDYLQLVHTSQGIICARY